VETWVIVALFLLLSPFLVLGLLAGLVNVYLLVVKLPLALVEFLRDLVKGPPPEE